MDDYEAQRRIFRGDYSGLGFDTSEDRLQEFSDAMDAQAYPEYIDEEQDEE